MTTLICDCNRTMPLNPQALGAALHEDLTLHSALCRREAPAFQKALLAAEKSGESLAVACTQESRLFTELASQTEGIKGEHPLKFINIRETGGWSRDAAKAMPKMAALLALAKAPDPEPVPTVTYKSAGRLLVIGPLDEAERLAALLDDTLEITLFTQGAGLTGGAQARRYPVLSGRIDALTGWLGAFELSSTRTNPIDLDVCTRCNACLSVCPEGAIGLDYQIDSELCKSHGDCSKVCSIIGAIDFHRKPESQVDAFDLVLDLRSDLQIAQAPATAFTQHAPPQGYFRPADGRLSETQTLLKLRDLVGEFEKPKFFVYKQKLCAHSRNKQVGCDACIEVCSALAISSESSRQQIKVNPNLCVGCGACTTVCPTGALTYAYPRASEQGVKLKTLLTTYARAGGKDAAVLLHSQEAGTQAINTLGRAAQLGSLGNKGGQAVQGVPARVLPVPLWHTASTGLDVWLTAIAYGASQVWVLMTNEEAPQYRAAVRAQMDTAQAILTGMGYTGTHFAILDASDGRDVAPLDRLLQAPPAQGVARAASFAVQADKRATLDLALDYLLEQASLKPEVIALSDVSPFGSLQVNTDTCTLCLSCVSACPASALHDNALMPQLKFIEKNCVQCGLCVTTCPENAITLQPRLLLTPQRKEARVLNEAKPYACVRCSKPFGTLKAIEAMLGKLAGHSMFQGDALERLKMCGDCRVIDIYSSTNESKITDL
jgi:ferredoxin